MKYLMVCLAMSLTFHLQSQFELEVEGDARVQGRIDLESAGMHNAFVGFGAGIALLTGQNNSFFGYRAGFLTSTGSDNTFIGYEAGRNNGDGVRNTALGMFALSDNKKNSKNIALGARALLSFVDGFGLDPQAANQDLGTTYNLAIGTSAGLFTNDLNGNGAERNTFVGNNSGLFNSTGYRNAFFGFQAGDANATGRYNTCVGHEADVSANNLINAGAFGSLAIVNASNKIRIGDGAVTTVEGNGWSLPSDGRFKTNVKNDVPGLEFIMGLRPVTYQFDVLAYHAHVRPQNFKRKSNAIDPKQSEMKSNAQIASQRVHTGFIAQEVEDIAKKLNFNFNGVVTPKNQRDNYGLSYALFVVPVVKSIQEQQQQIEELKHENLALQTQNIQLHDRLSQLESLVAGLIAGEPSVFEPITPPAGRD